MNFINQNDYNGSSKSHIWKWLESIQTNIAMLRHRIICYVDNTIDLVKIMPLLNSLNRPTLILADCLISSEIEAMETIEILSLSDIVSSIAIELYKKHSQQKKEETIYLEILLYLFENTSPDGVIVFCKDDQRSKIEKALLVSKLAYIIINTDSEGNPCINAKLLDTQMINSHIPVRLEKFGRNCWLHLGCGPNIIPGWVNVDICAWNPDIFMMDASKPFPFKDSSFDYIYSEHMFEHLRYNDGKAMLKECYRVLTDNGILRIAMPNIAFLMDLYINPQSPLNDRYIKWCYDTFLKDKGYNRESKTLNIAVINNFFYSWGHNFIHSVDEFLELSTACNFHVGAVCTIGESDFAPLRNIEHHHTQIPKWVNELETFVVELKK